MNGNETGKDCGGPCAPCAPGGPCNYDEDCTSMHCWLSVNYTCAYPTCLDARKNDNESDVDCGGNNSCARCAPGKHCTLATDCESRVCNNATCQASTCTDTVLNGKESDVDCGGSDCGACTVGQRCQYTADCAGYETPSTFCSRIGQEAYGTCTSISAACRNGVQDGTETDVDCGGSSGCPRCTTGMACLHPTDCTNGVCTSGVCASASCGDMVRNGNETDIDCGGDCPTCTVGMQCVRGYDCASKVCQGTCTFGACSSPVCSSPRCDDMVQNGQETDIDCGGSLCGACQTGRLCTDGPDCLTGYCNSTLKCDLPTCTDGVKNGQETDIDCGGGCASCNDGAMCIRSADCTSRNCSHATCMVPTCGDHITNGNETDIDCGGADCPSCKSYASCQTDSDCLSKFCSNGVCAQGSCSDGRLNGNETGLDCGGPCPKCGNGVTCSRSSDCASQVCSNNTCAAPTCSDGLANGQETDVDCGGVCMACGLGKKCANANDCTSMACLGLVCVAPSCSDGVSNGNETDVDCGGGVCTACSSRMSCAVNHDCESRVCTNNTCMAATCTDGVVNGGETALDCGGPCPPCGDYAPCDVNSDCRSANCQAGICQCGDGLMNGNETDVDCGGTDCPGCATNKGCLANSDCQSKACDGTVWQCAPPTCTDGYQNGDETDADCGGATCSPCSPSQHCGSASDCTSNVCNTTSHLCQMPQCNDMVLNGNETGIDCGGIDCEACAPGQHCSTDADCSSKLCSASTHTCLFSSCSDGRLNGNETGLDCGGPCPKCGNGVTCSRSSDCASQVCSNNTCAAPTCSDGLANGQETDVDCGGVCMACGLGKKCANANDCTSMACLGLVCVAPSCSDGVSNGNETDVDCGGGVCTACSSRMSCAVNHDCESRVCTNNTCMAATCTDGVVNGGETALDCGGPCPPCGDYAPCDVNSDCRSANCQAGICQCGDGLMNGNETDVDCGGTDCPGCATNKGCLANSDCQSKACDGTVWQCAPPTCTDGYQNGDETDADCGGATCSPCSPSQHCGSASDCTSNVCNTTSHLCQMPQCNDMVLNGNETGIDCGGECTSCSEFCPDELWLQVPSTTTSYVFNGSLHNVGSGFVHYCQKYSCTLECSCDGRNSSSVLALNDSGATQSFVVNCSHTEIHGSAQCMVSFVNPACWQITSKGVVVDNNMPYANWSVNATGAVATALVTMHFSEIVYLSMDNFSLIGATLVSTRHGPTKLQNVEFNISGTPGGTFVLFIPAPSYHDEAGNYGKDINVTAVLPSNGDNLRTLITAVSPSTISNAVGGAAISATLANGLVTAAGTLSPGVAMKTNLLRTGYHIQLLSMTASLAVPDIPDVYRSLGQQMGWSTLSGQVQNLQTFKDASTNSSRASRKLQQTLGLNEDSSSLMRTFVYVASAAAISIATLLAVHWAVNTGWRLLLKRPVPSLLIMPCAEVMVLGFLLTAVSYYAGALLGPNTVTSAAHRSGFWVVHVGLCLPYAAFLFWLASAKFTAIIMNRHAPPGNAVYLSSSHTVSRSKQLQYMPNTQQRAADLCGNRTCADCWRRSCGGKLCV